MSRAEFTELQRRVESMDAGGTRGVAVLGVQIQEIAKDVARVEKDFVDHRREHTAAEAARVTSRRWLIAAFIAAIAAVDGPIVSIVLTRGGH